MGALGEQLMGAGCSDPRTPAMLGPGGSLRGHPDHGFPSEMWHPTTSQTHEEELLGMTVMINMKPQPIGHSPCSHSLTWVILLNYYDSFVVLKFADDLAIKGMFLYTMKYFSAKK